MFICGKRFRPRPSATRTRERIDQYGEGEGGMRRYLFWSPDSSRSRRSSWNDVE